MTVLFKDAPTTDTAPTEQIEAITFIGIQKDEMPEMIAALFQLEAFDIVDMKASTYVADDGFQGILIRHNTYSVQVKMH